MDLITFDLDETLIHSLQCHWHAFNDAFKKFGLKNRNYKKFEPLLNGRRAHDVAKIVHPELSSRKINEIVNEHHRLIATRYGHYARQIKGVVPALKKLKRKYKLGIVTNCSHIETNGLLRGAKIDKKLFLVIVGKDDVRKSKPWPDEIFKAEKLTGINIAYHVGDSPFDIIAGKRAGVKTIGVLTGVNSRKKLAREKPYLILKSASELPKVVL